MLYRAQGEDVKYGNRIGGQIVFGSSSFESVNPAHSNDVLGEFPISDPSAVAAAAASASEAQKRWAKIPIPGRGEIIARCGRELSKRKDELSRLVAREVGKVLAEAGGDVQEAIDMAYFIAGQGRGVWGEVRPSELPNKMCWTTRQPVGVVGLITPWNFPIAIPAWKIFPALLAGNGIVLKPSELSPLCAEMFVDVLVTSGVPADLLNVVHGFGEVGSALCSDPLVRAIGFTGSVATGRKVACEAYSTGPRLVSLELGGKNAMVVLDDADLDLAARGAVFGAFGTSGQRCTSTSRLVVQRGVLNEVVDLVQTAACEMHIGDPLDSHVEMGPVINEDSLKRIANYVDNAIGSGATLVCGGRGVEIDGCDGSFYAPTVLGNVTASSTIACEEVFGPVLAVIAVDDLDEAIQTVNGVDLGLSAAIYSKDISKVMYALDQFNTGIAYANAPSIGAEIQLPFGGTKHTGNGFREAGARGLEQFSEIKSNYIDYSGNLQRAQIDNRPAVS